MKKLISYIKANYTNPENILIKVILTHFLLFLLLAFAKATYLFSGSYTLYNTLFDKLVLPLDWQTLIHQPWSLITYTFAKPVTGFGLLSFLSLSLQAMAVYFWGLVLVRFFNGRRFLQIYLVTSITAAIGLLLSSFYISYLPSMHIFGLSTPLYGIIASIATLMPNCIFFVFSSRVKAKYIALFMMLYALLTTYYPESRAQSIANLMAALSGFLYIKYLQYKGSKKSIFRWWQSSFNASKKNSNHSRRKKKNSTITQEELQNLLDKVSEKGYQSLTLQEKRDLFDS